MQDTDNNTKNTASGSDSVSEALSDADRVIAEAIKRREAEEAIAETDRAVAELARARLQAQHGGSSVPSDAGSGPSDEIAWQSDAVSSEKQAAGNDASQTISDAGGDPSSSAPEEKNGAGHDRSADNNDVRKKRTGSSDKMNARGSEKLSRNKNVSGRHHLRKPAIAAAVIAGVCLCAFLIVRYTPTSKRMSYTEYFGQMNDDEAAIVLQDENLAVRALVSDSGSLYLPYDLVRSELNERFYWDSERSDMLFTTPLQTFEIPVNSTSYTVIDGALTSDPTSEASFSEIILLRDDDGTPTSGAHSPSVTGIEAQSDAGADGTSAAQTENLDASDTSGSNVSVSDTGSTANLYLSASFMLQYTDMTYDYHKESSHVYIRNVWGDTLTAEASKDAAVRYQGNIKSPILTDLDKGDMVMVLDEGDRWLRVLTNDGYIGYVKSDRMSAPAVIDIQNNGFTPPDYTTLAYDGTVSLVWHMISTQDGNDSFDDATEQMSGVNVISPTWFSLIDDDGNVESIGTKAYVNKAHAKDLKVWGLVSDFSSDMDTSEVLASTTARRSCIGQLVGYAQTLGLDGINLDFEYMEEADALSYTQFVRELSIACRRASLVLSVDLVPPFDFNSYLNRIEIATVSDYLITMGYDEHYSGSAEAGSVASLSYEETAIQKLINMGISEKKLISAVPFYTRIWYTSTGSDGTTYVNSEELSMSSVSATLDSWHLTPTWDPDTCQNYVGWYTDDGVLCQIWIEDAESLQRKLLLIPKYQLGGAAIWALGFETGSIWTTVEDSLSKTQDEAEALEAELEESEAARVESQTEVEVQTETAATEADAA